MIAPGLTTVFTKGTCLIYFEATEEGKGEESPNGRMKFRFGLCIPVNENINFGFSIKNLFESQAPTFPLFPKI